MRRSRSIPLPLFLFLLLPLSPCQEKPALPLQEGRDLRNSTLLPVLPTPARKSLAALRRSLAAKDWTRAARLLLDLSRGPDSSLVGRGKRWAEGLLVHLAGMIASSPPDLQKEIQTLCREGWSHLWGPGVTDRERLTALVRSFPFLPQTGKAILALADLDLEEGRPREALSVLRRADLLPPSLQAGPFHEEVEGRRDLARKTLALLADPWPLPEGEADRVPPPREVSRDLKFRKSLVLRAAPSFFGTSSIPKPTPPRRGWIPAGRNWVLCGGLACVHDGRRLWRVDPAALSPAGPPLPLFSFLRIFPSSAAFLSRRGEGARPLPMDLAAHGDLLALIAGPRPKPGDSPGGHALACLRVFPGKKNPLLLWVHRGSLQGPLPADLPAEDARTLRKGPLSFGAGPVWVGEDLLALIHAPLDKTRVSCYLARFDGKTGRARWVTFLAQGAPEALDPLFDRLAAMPFPRLRGAPLCLVEGAVICATGLGTVQAVDAWDGRHLWAFRTARARPQVDEVRGMLRSAVMEDGGRILAALEDSNWLYLFRPFPAPGNSPLLAPPLPRWNLSLLLGLRGKKAYFLSAQGDEYSLCRITLPEGKIYVAPPLQKGEHFLGRPLLAKNAVLFCTEDALYRADTRRDLYLELEFEPPQGSPALMGSLLPWKGGLLSLGPQAIGFWR